MVKTRGFPAKGLVPLPGYTWAVKAAITCFSPRAAGWKSWVLTLQVLHEHEEGRPGPCSESLLCLLGSGGQSWCFWGIVQLT